MKKLFLTIVVVSIIFPAANVFAGAYNNSGPWISPYIADQVPSSTDVPGKVYSDNPDKNAPLGTPSLENLQTIHWDGLGGREDGIDFKDTTTGLDTQQVDALANQSDALFSGVVNNQVPIIVSLVGDVTWDGVTTDYPLLYEKASGSRGYWCTDTGTVPNKVNVDQEGVVDLDGVDLWGSDTVLNTDRFSIVGDAFGVAVYNADGTTAFSDAELVTAIATQLGLSGSQETELLAGIDVDATMVSDDQLLFSISALSITDYDFIGDEVWVYDQTGGTTAWLNHGGHLWDTNWSFDELGHAFDVDGLEAVPEPCTLCLLGASGVIALCRRKR